MNSSSKLALEAGNELGPNLFTPLKLGPLNLKSRFVLAPLTRNRAGPGNVPQAMNATYYRQRASAGLIISEATQISPQGVGYPGTPGIHSQEQVEGWRLVTDAVRTAGGHIFLQLWHVGRISHPLLQPDGALPVAPSAIKPQGEAPTLEGMKAFVTPRALETAEIPGIVEDYRQAAINAKAAGFDGVEIHGANGYLLDQFLRDGSNHRKDIYGGSLENRTRLLIEVTEAVVEVWGAERVGIRLSPVGRFNDMSDSNPQQTFEFAAKSLSRFGLAYLHVVERQIGGDDNERSGFDFAALGHAFGGPYMANGGFDKARAENAVENGDADLISFGKLFLANPDLPRRLALGAPLNQPDPATFYGGGEQGYTDYPFLKPATAAV